MDRAWCLFKLSREIFGLLILQDCVNLQELLAHALHCNKEDWEIKAREMLVQEVKQWEYPGREIKVQNVYGIKGSLWDCFGTALGLLWDYSGSIAECLVLSYTNAM